MLCSEFDRGQGTHMHTKSMWHIHTSLVSFAEYRVLYTSLLQKRPVILTGNKAYTRTRKTYGTYTRQAQDTSARHERAHPLVRSVLLRICQGTRHTYAHETYMAHTHKTRARAPCCAVFLSRAAETCSLEPTQRFSAWIFTIRDPPY